jgi:flagellar protein FlaG
MIHDVTSKADLPAMASRGSDQTDAANGRSRAAGTHSDTTDSVQPSRAQLDQAVGQIRDALKQADSHLQIEIDPELQRVIVKVVNGDTDEVIRQIPPKALLDLAKNLSEQSEKKGVLLREQA